MKNTIAKVEGDFIRDYRIRTKDNTVAYKEGRLKDFKVGWLCKSKGIGDMLGCMNETFEWNDELIIIKYSGGYAIGK